MGGIRVEQPLYMGGKIRAAYRMSVLGKEMAEMNEALTVTEVILKTDKSLCPGREGTGDEKR